MAYLTQASATVANSPKFSYYGWIRAVTSNSPGAGESFPILSWGDRWGPSYLSLFTNSSTNANQLNGYIIGVPNSIAMESYTDDGRIAGSGSIWTPNIGFSVPSTNVATYNATYASMLGPNKWIHIALAVDMTNASQKTAGKVVASSGKMACLINGTYIGRWFVPNTDMTTFPQTDVNASFGQDKIWSQATATTGGYQSLVYPGSDGSAGWFGPADVADDGNVATIPGWNIGINGTEVGLPAQSPDAAFISKIDYGDTQIWVGTYIDPLVSANFAKFVSISNGVGTPVNPSTAAAAFGTQTYLFKGGSTAFYTNGGSGGSFSKVGTLSDFTPGPSY